VTDPADPGTRRAVAVRCVEEICFGSSDPDIDPGHVEVGCGWTGMCVVLENGSIDPEENCGHCGGTVAVVRKEKPARQRGPTTKGESNEG
jgi:hypothetical protein